MLAEQEVKTEIVERYYQIRAIRKVAERLERDRQRRALVVMATGAGKTRTVIALCDLLMRAGWVKRVLFLADRVALVKQAGEHLQGTSAILVPGEPSVREERERACVHFDLSDHDGIDRSET